LIEQLMGVAFRTGAVHLRASPREPALRKARVCYDHLAGELGVLALEGLVSRGVLQQDTSGIRPGPSSAPWFSSLGIDVASLSMSRRLLCRPCLDWSERRHHLAGSLGAALLRRLFELKWARCANDSRVVLFSASGEREFRARFGPAAH